jgi:hypothetical protein
MKNLKTILILSFFGLSFLIGYAQAFYLTDRKGELHYDNKILEASFTADDLDENGDFIFEEIRVNTTSDVEFYVKSFRENLELVEGMNAYVCFYTCDDTLGNQHYMECPIGGTESNEKIAPYTIHLRPHDKFGLSQFKIEFWSEEDKSDIQTLFVNLTMRDPSGIKEQSTASATLTAYPNPVMANTPVNVSYTLAQKSNANYLVVKNIMGMEVMRLPLNPNENHLLMDVSSLTSGIYFYAIESKNQIQIVKKLIIK